MEKPNTLSQRPDHGTRTSNKKGITLLYLELFAVCILEGVELTGVEQRVLSEIYHSNCKGNLEESITKIAQELHQSASRLIHLLEQSNINELLCFQGKIYVLQNLELQRQIVSLCYDSKIAGYSRHWKMLELVSCNYWWSQMSRYISQYISICDLCLHIKPIRYPLIGKLYSLLILEEQQNTLSVNFVVELSKSKGYNTVMIVVNSVSKRVHFIPTYTMVTMKRAVKLFFYYIQKLHGLPRCIVLDCRVQFITLFTKELYRLLGI